ncbi:25942_t:CDS:2 [Dentiscutata erythropus]|uniref:25942_t:CDS:1 n=1 Tax=Dentiscutata erythropus TaxID=1348616 RepID=A0A9N9BCF7_9GLOM|nr:25942_t:CDS:2 [Dentiscutata erythropus]
MCIYAPPNDEIKKTKLLKRLENNFNKAILQNKKALKESLSANAKWKIISKAIKRAAKKILPKKKVQKTLIKELPNHNLQVARKEVRKLNKLCRKCKTNLTKLIKNTNQEKIETKMKKIEEYTEEKV